MGYFYRKFENESLNKLYELFEDVTPLPADCGGLCGGACCKGGGEDGMLLFPGEKEYFAGHGAFTVFRDDRYDCDIVVCGGSCLRSERPLSCRIYPYFFYVSESGFVTVGKDIRAIGLCPLAEDHPSVSRAFLRQMRIGAKIIERDAELFAFAKKVSDLLTDFGSLD